MDNDKTLKGLRRQRGAMKAKLTAFRIFLETFDVSVDTIDEQDIINLEQCIERIKELITEYDACQLQIEQLTEDALIDECYAQRTEFETDFYTFISKAQKLLNELRPEEQIVNRDTKACSDTASQHSLSQRRKVKLPQLKLPQFDGSYEKWPTFRDMFNSIIHTDDSIDTIAKFQYLQGSLTGEALKVVEGLEVSIENYESAWNLLVKRYQNKILMIDKHIAGIVDYPKIVKEDQEALRKLIDSTRSHMRSLIALEQPVDKWDRILIYLVSGQLDAVSKREWEKGRKGHEKLPSMEEFLDFLEEHYLYLEKINTQGTLANNTHATKSAGKRKGDTSSLSHTSVMKGNCPLCQKEHALYACKSFLELSIPARIEQVRKKKICLNCLRSGHFAANCKSQKCRKCSKLHNTLLHIENTESADKGDGEDKSAHKSQGDGNSTKEIVSAHTAATNSVYQLLPTARVKIIDENGQIHRCNTLLDSGSQSNFMTTSLRNKLGLRTSRVDLSVACINQSRIKIVETTKATIGSIHSKYKEELTFLVVPRITTHLPNESLDIEAANIPNDIPLADPEFHKPKRIDLLIGVDLFWDLICHEPTRHPHLCKTKLGYIVSGKLPQQHKQRATLSCSLSTGTINIAQNLERFWEVEELPEQSPLSAEEQACELHFKNTVQRSDNGRFIVAIPFKTSINTLGDSKELATKRFKSLERKLQTDEKMRKEYIKFMQEYQRLGHMKKVVDDYSTHAYYLPHHGVWKESSITTKLRVVFDASAPTTTGISLNDIQMVGPTIQRDLLSIILCFRQHPYVVGADIAMMYRQVLIEPPQRTLQRILWRENPLDQIDTYELNTVTYGMASSPFMAIRCLFSLADEHQESYPEAADIIRKFMYVDDLLFGASSKEKATQLAKNVSHILSSGCFELRKWISNDPQILEGIGD